MKKMERKYSKMKENSIPINQYAISVNQKDN